MKNISIRIFTLILISSLATSLFAQRGSEVSLEGNMLNVRQIDSKEYAGKAYEGSPYLYEEFMEATVGEGEKIYKVRYNAYSDEMEVEIKEGSVIALSYRKEPYKIVFINNDMVFGFYPDLVDGKYYAQILWQSDDKALLKTVDKRFYKGQESDGYKPAKDPKFTDGKENYYFVDQNGDINELPNNPKKRASLFFDDKEIEKEIKSSDLNLREEDDMVKALKKYM